jgi:hypothetical protein
VDGTVDAKLDRLLYEQQTILVRLATIELQMSGTVAQRQDHEQRIRSIERWMWGVPASLLASIAAGVATVAMWARP